jgi:hypothetical protein
MKLKSLIGRKEKPKKAEPKKQHKPKDRSKYITPLPFSLTAEISKNYEGLADSLGGLITDLPIEIKTLFTNSEIKTVTYRQGYSLFVLENDFSIKIKDVKYANTHTKLITIKHKNAIMYNGYNKRK